MQHVWRCYLFVLVADSGTLVRLAGALSNAGNACKLPLMQALLVAPALTTLWQTVEQQWPRFTMCPSLWGSAGLP